MERKIIKTADGSTTIQLPQWNEQYHSMHGAVQESRHVFLKTGLDYWMEKNEASTKISILEIGFGTGLNALLTAVHLESNPISIHYEGVEAYPVTPAETEQLNYIDLLEKPDFNTFFEQMHHVSWNEIQYLKDNFQLKKRQQKFEEITDFDRFDLVYFDAFGAQVQPELWDEIIFKKMFSALRPNGVLVTYAAKGSVRRAMQAVGFTVERLPGPPGKREMLRGLKF